MATIEKWNPYGVAMDITATGGTVTRTSATQYTVVINASWEVSYSGNQTNYGMKAASGGVTKVISSFGTKRGSGSAEFTGTYSISGNGAATKSVTVTFENYKTDNGDSAKKSVSFNVNVPAWTSYTVSYNANGGTGAPSAQTKWKGQTLTLSSATPTRTGYSFQGWALSKAEADAGNWYYKAGYDCGRDENLTLYAVWKANTYTVKYNANGGTGAPGNQTKTYGVSLKLSTVVPTKKDYKFLGWATSATASTAQYASGANYTTNSAVTLYAVWALDYVKPIISNFTVGRCNSDGTLNDEGTYATVGFKWKCVRTLSSVCVYWTINGTEKSVCLQTSSTDDSARITIGGGEFSTDKSYQIKVVVADSDGQNEATKTLYSLKLAVDCLPQNKGVSFGKTAELEDTADFAYTIYPRAGFIHPIIAAGADLNEQMTPGIYAGENVSTKPYINSPITSGTFTLEIMSAGPNGQLMQRLTRCDKNIPEVYERWYYTSAWGDWYGGWIYPSIASAFAMYGTDTAANQPRYRKDGRMVEVRGIVTPASDLAGGNTIVPIFTLPNGYRPNSPIYVICQGSGNCVWLLRVNTDGEVGFSRYRNGNAAATATAGTWLPFQVTYFAK